MPRSLAMVRIYCRALLLVGIPTVIAHPSVAQSNGRRGPYPAIAIGFGPSSSDPPYQGSFHLSGRLGVGWQPVSRMHVEAAFHTVIGAPFQGELACDVAGGSCPANYGFLGGTLGLAMDAGPRANPALLRVAFGAGGYRVRQHRPVEPAIPDVTVLGLYAGLETTPHRWARGALAIGIRATALPGVNGATLWFVPIEIALRFW